ncbi:hypothetical protein [Magnetofaba australis]|nr:hypothetical protein [Magnetofaba australis]
MMKRPPHHALHRLGLQTTASALTLCLGLSLSLVEATPVSAASMQSALSAKDRAFIDRVSSQACLEGGTVADCLDAKRKEKVLEDKGWEVRHYARANFSIVERKFANAYGKLTPYTWMINSEGHIAPQNERTRELTHKKVNISKLLNMEALRNAPQVFLNKDNPGLPADDPRLLKLQAEQRAAQQKTQPAAAPAGGANTNGATPAPGQPAMTQSGANLVGCLERAWLEAVIAARLRGIDAVGDTYVKEGKCYMLPPATSVQFIQWESARTPMPVARITWNRYMLWTTADAVRLTP